MSQQAGDPTPSEEAIRQLRDQELLDLIRDTVARLNELGNRLEQYARGTDVGGISVNLSEAESIPCDKS